MPIPTGLALAPLADSPPRWGYAGFPSGFAKPIPTWGGEGGEVAGGWANGDGDRLDDAESRVGSEGQAPLDERRAADVIAGGPPRRSQGGACGDGPERLKRRSSK